MRNLEAGRLLVLADVSSAMDRKTGVAPLLSFFRPLNERRDVTVGKEGGTCSASPRRRPTATTDESPPPIPIPDSRSLSYGFGSYSFSSDLTLTRTFLVR